MDIEAKSRAELEKIETMKKLEVARVKLEILNEDQYHQTSNTKPSFTILPADGMKELLNKYVESCHASVAEHSEHENPSPSFIAASPVTIPHCEPAGIPCSDSVVPLTSSCPNPMVQTGATPVVKPKVCTSLLNPSSAAFVPVSSDIASSKVPSVLQIPQYTTGEYPTGPTLPASSIPCVAPIHNQPSAAPIHNQPSAAPIHNQPSAAPTHNQLSAAPIHNQISADCTHRSPLVSSKADTHCTTSVNLNPAAKEFYAGTAVTDTNMSSYQTHTIPSHYDVPLLPVHTTHIPVSSATGTNTQGISQPIATSQPEVQPKAPIALID